MSEVAAGRFPARIYAIVFAVILVVALLPVIASFSAAAIAESHGCALDEGNVHPCLVLGSDWGTILYGLFVLGWLALATIPYGGMALIVWLVVLLIHYFAWRRSRGEPTK